MTTENLTPPVDINEEAEKAERKKRYLDDLPKHRDKTVEAWLKAQSDYDKTVLALSGGALAVSFTFLKEVVKTEPVYCWHYLICAWSFWASSSLCVLISFFSSVKTHYKEIESINDEISTGKHCDIKTSRWDNFVTYLNYGGLGFFIIGLVYIIVFSYCNLSVKNHGLGGQVAECNYFRTCDD